MRAVQDERLFAGFREDHVKTPTSSELLGNSVTNQPPISLRVLLNVLEDLTNTKEEASGEFRLSSALPADLSEMTRFDERVSVYYNQTPPSSPSFALFRRSIAIQKRVLWPSARRGPFIYKAGRLKDPGVTSRLRRLLDTRCWVTI